MESFDPTEFYLKISGSPELRNAVKKIALILGSDFQIESDEEISDPAAQGFKLSKAVAIVTIIAGSLTAADLSAKLIDEIEHSHSKEVTFATPKGDLHLDLKEQPTLTPEQRKAVEELFDSMLKK